MSDWKEEGFERHNELGFISEYIKLDQKTKTIRPVFDADELLKDGYAPKGSKVTYLNRNGYDGERDRMNTLGVQEGDILTVKTCSIGGWRSSYTFEEIEGSHNTVMFEVYKN